MNDARLGPAELISDSSPSRAEDFAAYVRDGERQHKRLALLLAADTHEAEDLLQAAYAKVYPRWTTVRSYDVPDAYLRRVMVTLRTSWWRRSLRRERATPDLPAHAGAGGDPAAQVVESLALLDALRRLPERQRAAVVLRHWCDLSEADTAATMRCSIGTVKSSTSRGLAHLRDALSHAEGWQS